MELVSIKSALIIQFIYTMCYKLVFKVFIGFHVVLLMRNVEIYLKFCTNCGEHVAFGHVQVM